MIIRTFPDQSNLRRIIISYICDNILLFPKKKKKILSLPSSPNFRKLFQVSNLPLYLTSALDLKTCRDLKLDNNMRDNSNNKISPSLI